MPHNSLFVLIIGNSVPMPHKYPCGVCMGLFVGAMCKHPFSFSNNANNYDTYTLWLTLSEVHRSTGTTDRGLEEMGQRRPWNTTSGGCSTNT